MKKSNYIYPKGENHHGYKHGQSLNGTHTRLWGIWQGMLVRTTNPKHKDYKYYGAKGIAVCDEWHDSITFFNWALENGYTDNLTIDRINGKKNYCPENCRWTTQRDNTMNRTQRDDCGIYNNGHGYFIRIRRYSKYYYGGFDKDIKIARKLRDDLLLKIDKL